MRKDYQNREIDTSQPAVPDTVSVALGELAGELREGLLALAVGAGLQVLAAMMEDDVAAACGPRGKHDPQRTASRHGRGGGAVTLGGRRVPVERPRMRAVDGSGSRVGKPRNGLKELLTLDERKNNEICLDIGRRRRHETHCVQCRPNHRSIIR